MKIVMVAVVSANGKITRGNDPHIYEWTSKEDQKLFFSTIEQNGLIVMGSKTYEAAKKVIKLRPGKLRVVMTRDPQKYKHEQVKGQLEFLSDNPSELVSKFGSTHKKMLLVGGSEINTEFVKAGLVDEIYLTIEPAIFGKGKNVFAEDEFESSLALFSVGKLNRKGTLLLKYKVVK